MNLEIDRDLPTEVALWLALQLDKPGKTSRVQLTRAEPAAIFSLVGYPPRITTWRVEWSGPGAKFSREGHGGKGGRGGGGARGGGVGGTGAGGGGDDQGGAGAGVAGEMAGAVEAEAAGQGCQGCRQHFAEGAWTTYFLVSGGDIEPSGGERLARRFEFN